MTQEHIRLEDSRMGRAPWKKWGPYLSERAWGNPREDYSADGSPWEYFPHDHARSRAYRWTEDGLAGICDNRQFLCFSIALWNGRDPILKERLFGLTGNEGRHGEDVKEYYFYLDSTPTHSYMKYLYKYPQAPFPYAGLIEGDRRRGRDAPEFELLDTGVFDGDRYFDVIVEYAKDTPEEILIRVTIANRGTEPAVLDLLPTIWFRNTWSWGQHLRRSLLTASPPLPGTRTIQVSHADLGERRLVCEGEPDLLFTENETNLHRLFGVENLARYVKDGINDYVVGGVPDTVNPEQVGTKAAAHYRMQLRGGETRVCKIRLTSQTSGAPEFDAAFDDVFDQRIREANEFYASIAPPDATDDECLIQRQAFAGLLWSKQFYHYDIRRWLRGDLAGPEPPASHKRGRNRGWTHLYNADILSVPDKWEFPWYAAWDLAFHCIPLALVDPTFAKEQLILLLREWYMHPNGQLPACEWNLADVNPPVHAWAAWRVYKIEQKHFGRSDRLFLERVFHKLLLNFTWWVNRKDATGNNVFQGGFLGLDNIGAFNRSEMAPAGGAVEQSDATSWMGMYCLNMLVIALELARENPAYEDVASKFLEHFAYISRAMNNIGDQGIRLWDQADGFYYDILRLPDGRSFPLRLRSMVGLIPLFAVETLESDVIDTLQGFKRRMQWFIDNLPEFGDSIETETTETGVRRFLSLVNWDRLRRLLKVMLDESEFLSPHGVRSLSRAHGQDPYVLRLDGAEHRVSYEPAESRTGLFGGNSNWRGPVWFPVNYLIIESLQKFHYFLGDTFRVEFPTGSGHEMNLWNVSIEIERRLTSLFLRDENGHRAVYGSRKLFQSDPQWRDRILFYEYFHGDTGVGLGASHQTGWTGLVAKLIQQSGTYLREQDHAGPNGQ
jgi:hypothetical protein